MNVCTWVVSAENFAPVSDDKVVAGGFQWGYQTDSRNLIATNFNHKTTETTIKPVGVLWVIFIIRDADWSFRLSNQGKYPDTPLIYEGIYTNELVYNYEHSRGEGGKTVVLYSPNAENNGVIHFQLAVQKKEDDTLYIWDPQIENNGTGEVDPNPPPGG